MDAVSHRNTQKMSTLLGFGDYDIAEDGNEQIGNILDAFLFILRYGRKDLEICFYFHYIFLYKGVLLHVLIVRGISSSVYRQEKYLILLLPTSSLYGHS